MTTRRDGHQPGPVFMSEKQMGEYLNDLRNNRVPRPAGSRPLPVSSSRRTIPAPEVSVSADAQRNPVPRRQPSLFSLSGPNPLPAVRNVSAEQHLTEKEEAHKVRLALEKMDLQNEDQLLRTAGDEAMSLIRDHQMGRNLGSVSSRNPTCAIPSSIARQDRPVEHPQQQLPPAEALTDSKAPPRLAQKLSFSKLASRRRSSGTKRKPSGKQMSFPNPDDKIYEDPPDQNVVVVAKVPTWTSGSLNVRRNPFARAKSMRQSLPVGRTSDVDGVPLNKVEVQRNPPSQLRNPNYLTNTNTEAKAVAVGDADIENTTQPRFKDGVEIRDEDIRAATSMKLKDRSPRLPSPAVTSSSHSRPIVSFSKDWKPPAKPSRNDNTDSTQYHIHRSRGELVQTKSDFAPAAKMTETSTDRPTSLAIPQININPLERDPLPVPSDEGNEYDGCVDSNNIPTISIIGVPSIQLDDMSEYNTSSSPDLLPAHNQHATPHAPLQPHTRLDRSTTAPPIMIDQVSDITPLAHSSNQSHHHTRPLPIPSSHSIPQPRPLPRHNHSAPTPTTTSHNPTLCAQCALPIAGRLVSAAGARFHPECFACFHCATPLECVAFYPEPTAHREQRLAPAADGEEGSTDPTDADPSPRFYCHLDFHESFSPRCRGCQTPIEGEVVVACGAEWHVGHFFCAQCGDPFDPTTPFVERDGYAWCVGCHTNRFSPKCKQCRKPVVGTVLRALGAEWHEECFCCVECAGPFEGGQYFLRGAGAVDPVCVECEGRRLKMYGGF